MFNYLRLLMVAVAFACGGMAMAVDGGPGGTPSQSVTVSGQVELTLILRPDDLRKFPAAQIIELPMVGRDGADKGSFTRVRGVRLRDIVDQAKIVKRDQNTVKKLIIIAGATDGYRALFSWNELFNSPIGDDVLVIFERDGKALAADEGMLSLVSGRDIRSGPRHVKWLQTVEVRQVAE